MSVGAIDPSQFTIPFEYVGGDLSDHSARFAAIRDALGLPPDCEPRFIGAGLSYTGPFEAGRRYAGAIRVNGVHKRKSGGATLESVSYSLFISDEGAIKGWTGDLDAGYATKPSEVWFARDGVRLPMTDELRAAIKALVPKRPAR